MQTSFVLLATSDGTSHYAAVHRLSEIAGLLEWMHSSEVLELMDVGPSRFKGYNDIKILDQMFLPLARAMVFPNSEPFHLIQDNNPFYTSSVMKA